MTRVWQAGRTFFGASSCRPVNLGSSSERLRYAAAAGAVGITLLLNLVGSMAGLFAIFALFLTGTGLAVVGGVSVLHSDDPVVTATVPGIGVVMAIAAVLLYAVFGCVFGCAG